MSNTCIRPASTLASRVGCWCLPIYQSAMAPFASRRTLQRLAQDLRRVPPQRRISLLDSDHDGDDAAIRPLDVCHFALGKLGDLNGSKGRGERRGRDAPRRDKTRQSDSIRFASLHFTSLHFDLSALPLSSSRPPALTFKSLSLTQSALLSVSMSCFSAASSPVTGFPS